MRGVSDSQRAYARKLFERARDLSESDAFAPPPSGVGKAITPEAAREDIRQAKRKNRRMIIICSVVLVIIAAFSLHLPYYGSKWAGDGSVVYSTMDVLSCYKLWFQCTVMPLFDNTLYNQITSMQQGFDMSMYGLLMNRAAATLVIVACGFMLAVSGLLFQASFRNPLAAPTMLGVSDGVSLGMIVFTFLGYTSVAANASMYLLCVYGCGVVVLLLVLVLSRFMAGGRKYSAMDMLLIGNVMSQLLGGVVSYITNFGMDLTTWNNFYEIQQGMGQMDEPLTWAVVLVVTVATMVPVFLLRFRFNLVSYSNEEQRMLGARPGLLRGAALALGCVMQLAAIASIGQVAMVSLAVPFLVRYMFRNEFRSQLLGNFLVGSVVLLLCAAIQVFAVFSNQWGSVGMPLGTIVAFVIMPFFVWMMALQKRGWE